MATNERSPSTPKSTPDQPDSGAGMDHTTVVPTNFDPDAPGRRRD